jgi:putative peptidoglycan lipid II flippase
MVRRLFSVIEREISGVHNAAYLLGICAFMSQCLALVRDKLLAHQFGAGQLLDIYYSSFRIPDFIFATVASLVSISVLIPFLAKSFEKDGEGEKKKTKALVDTIFNGYMLLMMVVAGLAFVLMPYLTKLVMPTLQAGPVRDELIYLSRILLLQPLALGISNLLGSITQVTKRFFIYALSPLFYNASIIAGIVFLAPLFGLRGIMWGVVIGSIFHFAIQIPYVAGIKLLPSFTLNVKWKDLKEVMLLSFPRTLTLSLASLELIFITLYASYMIEGSIAIFNLALNLQSVPFAIIGVSYSLAAFPTLSRLFSSGDKAKFLEHVEVAARHIIFWALPITALFIVLRAQIVRTILGSGSFNWDDTRLTAACLSLFIISLVAQSLKLLFVRAYYAAGNTRKPLIINVLSSLLTIGLPLAFMILWRAFPTFGYFIELLFKVDDVPGAIVLALPLGYSIGNLINMAVLWFAFKLDFKDSLNKAAATLFHSLGTAVITGFVAYLALGALPRLVDTTHALGIFLQGFVAGIIGILAAVGVLSLLKNPELNEVMAIIPRKIFKEKNVVLDDVGKID